MSGKKAFGKFRKLVVVTTIAGLGAVMSAAGCCGSSCNSCEPSCNTCASPCGDCSNWDYAHGGTRHCGAHSCGGK